MRFHLRFWWTKLAHISKWQANVRNKSIESNWIAFRYLHGPAITVMHACTSYTPLRHELCMTSASTSRLSVTMPSDSKSSRRLVSYRLRLTSNLWWKVVLAITTAPRCVILYKCHLYRYNNSRHVEIRIVFTRDISIMKITRQSIIRFEYCLICCMINFLNVSIGYRSSRVFTNFIFCS